MPSTEPKFLLISTNGFCPLFDTGDSAARKQLESQLKELAKGGFHDKVGPDASLKGKSPEDFLAMIAKGEIGFMKATPKNSALKPRIAYSADGMPSLLGFLNTQMFVEPPAFEAKLDGHKLLLRVDLRIELKNLLKGASLARFVKAVKQKQISGVEWMFRANTKLDPLGYTCRMFQQSADAYTFGFFATKKLLQEAGQ